MSKIKMLLDVVQDMRSLTDSLEALARAIEEPEEQQGDAVRMEQIAESVPASPPQPATESQQAPDPPQDPRAVGWARRGQAH